MVCVFVSASHVTFLFYSQSTCQGTLYILDHLRHTHTEHLLPLKGLIASVRTASRWKNCTFVAASGAKWPGENLPHAIWLLQTDSRVKLNRSKALM